MAIDVKCDRCLKDLTEPGALVLSPPFGVEPPIDGMVVSKLHICGTCWVSMKQWIVLHKRFMGRSRVERCPESDFPAPNDRFDEGDFK